jgi:hypothetical protein
MRTNPSEGATLMANIEDPVTISAMIPSKLLDEVRELAAMKNLAYAEIVREALKLWVDTAQTEERRHRGTQIGQ